MRLATCLLTVVTATAALADHPSAPAHAPGFTVLQVESRAGGPLTVELWYPADPGADLTEVASNPVWQGTLAAVDAAPVAGRYPVVLLSHGLDGAARNLAWLGAALAAAGHVVTAPNHAGTGFAAPDPVLRADLGARPQQLHRALAAVLDDARIGPLADGARVVAVGHSLGGFTVLAAAGVGIEVARMDCADAVLRPDCAFLAEAGVDGDWAAVGSLQPTGTISALVTLDAGLTQALHRADLANLTVPLLIVGAGAPDNPLPLDVESRALAAAVPAADYVELEGAVHFDFLGLCTAEALDVLAEEEPGASFDCAPSPMPRVEVHAQTIQLVREVVARLPE
ncbi:MAG: hypothetical protein EA356_02000 [Geminicoccaceae bacterium]|nr:MAG: hypothetical protein EA356_02000 [Geminicoccaceae bacterium]